MGQKFACLPGGCFVSSLPHLTSLIINFVTKLVVVLLRGSKRQGKLPRNPNKGIGKVKGKRRGLVDRCLAERGPYRHITPDLSAKQGRKAPLSIWLDARVWKTSVRTPQESHFVLRSITVKMLL